MQSKEISLFERISDENIKYAPETGYLIFIVTLTLTPLRCFFNRN
jgi:hypothetical protein